MYLKFFQISPFTAWISSFHNLFVKKWNENWIQSLDKTENYINENW